MAPTGHREIVIIGGGIVGCTTAYYLSRHPSYSPSTTHITVLEASARGVAQGASGKAGGLVAKWAFPRDLVEISFPEHVKLANEHNGKERWGWRFVECGNWEGRGEDPTDHVSTEVASRQVRSSYPDGLSWVRGHLTESYSPISAPGGTAQVHPYLFTTSMMDLALEKGVTLLKGSATTIEREHGRVSSVRYKDPTDDSFRVVSATHVILSAGAWSPSIEPCLPISAVRAHSVTVRPNPGVTIAPYVLFTAITLPRGQLATPEIYARPDNEIYACGPGDADSPLPANVDDVDVDESACGSIWEHVASISVEFREGRLDKRQACFLPVVRSDAGPIIGEARTLAEGLYIATGHTCWGICNAPGTAKVIAELIMDGQVGSGNVASFGPEFFL